MNILPPPPTRGLSRACSKSYKAFVPSVPIQSSVQFGTRTHPPDAPRRDLKAENAKTRLVEREFLLSLLKNSPSKRDAKAYISRFDLPPKGESDPQLKAGGRSQPSVPASFDSWWLHKTGVNLGNLYTPARAIGESPVFSQVPLLDQATTSDTAETIHIALVKLREPQALDDETLNGLAITLSQLIRLGLNIAVVIDCDDEVGTELSGPVSKDWDKKIHQHTDRVVSAIAQHNAPGSLKISDALGYSDYEQEVLSAVNVRSNVEVCNSKLLFPLLDSGIIPVLPPIASTTDLQNNRRVQADDVVLALTREFSGITSKVDTGISLPSSTGSSVTIKSLQKTPSLDRIIVLDPLGGIPSEERPDKAHVFINMEEEYEDIKKELTVSCTGRERVSVAAASKDSRPHSLFGSSNPISKFVEQEVVLPSKSTPGTIASTSTASSLSPRHIKNLDLFQQSLKLLPPASSGLITTPAAASISGQMETILPSPATGVRTRRVKNALIHNLLTDKPIVSSSLPLSRFTTYFNDQSTLSDITPNHPTFIKRGIPVTMIPDPRSTPWTTPGPEGTSLSLKDPSIDFPRLLHLIEDSFGRELDVPHYLSRIQNRVAGIIIAGEYEGGAICTWETPPNYPDSPPVPYLDKFAVLRRSQGTGGVADVVFKALLRTCFPDGCVWRSRTNNPVNKWYRERSAGSLKLPGGQWTMFWTMEGIESMRATGQVEGSQRWADWVDVCANVAPSWADAKPPD